MGGERGATVARRDAPKNDPPRKTDGRACEDARNREERVGGGLGLDPPAVRLPSEDELAVRR